MSQLDIYKKQAKQLVRWHREGNYSIGGRIRGLARYETLTDREALALEFPLREAQEIIALEAGYTNWAALKVAVTKEPTPAKALSPTPRLTRAVPVILVLDVQASADFFRATLGFSIDFLHGQPAFYGSVSRDGACLHLKFVHEPVLAVGAQDRDGLISRLHRGRERESALRRVRDSRRDVRPEAQEAGLGGTRLHRPRP